MIRSRIIGTGHYLPERVVTNQEMEGFVDTTDAWIRQRTGIGQRYIAAAGESTSDMGAKAAERALESAGVEAAEVDYILCATLTPDSCMPSSACYIQTAIGATNAAALDVNAACSGFVYAMEIADAFIRAGVHQTILVVGAEKLSDLLVWEKRDTAVLFGDGAGAVVVRGVEGEAGILSTYSTADGSAAPLLHVPSGGSRLPLTPENINETERGIVMNGRELYKRAVVAFGQAIEQAIARANVAPEDVALLVPHQANIRIIASAAKRIGMSEDKIFVNLEQVGNTSAASIPLALDQAQAAGRLKPGDIVLLAAFGAGLTWGSVLLRW